MRCRTLSFAQTSRAIASMGAFAGTTSVSGSSRAEAIESINGPAEPLHLVRVGIAIRNALGSRGGSAGNEARRGRSANGSAPMRR